MTTWNPYPLNSRAAPSSTRPRQVPTTQTTGAAAGTGPANRQTTTAGTSGPATCQWSSPPRATGFVRATRTGRPS